MKRSLVLLTLGLPFLGACGMLMQQPQQASPNYQMPKESEQQLRKGEADAYERSAQAQNEELDKAEQESVKALKLALGKESVSPGLPAPLPAAEAINELTTAKIKLRLEHVKAMDGSNVNNDFLQVKDSFTDRVQVLSKKLGEGKASKAETKEIQEGAKHVGKLNDLKMQVLNASMATMKSNSHIQTSGLSTMLQVSQMVRTRKLSELEMTEDDYALVQKALATEKRAEAIAAVNLGLLATYQAVMNGKAEPKALQTMAEKSLEAFPLKVEVSKQDAKAYVKSLSGNVARIKQRYEKMMRDVHGDAKYEREYKASIDAMFKQALDAENQKSVNKIAAENQAKWAEEGPKADGPDLSFMDDGPIGNSIKGINALKNGDAKGALQAAISFVPVPGLKEGLSAVLSLFG